MPDPPVPVPVAFAGVDGELRGTLFLPPAPGLAPAVAVLPEVDGFCPGTEAAAARLARAGHLALALDLYAPLGGAPRLRGIEDTTAWILRLDDHRQLSDLAVAMDWLAEHPRADSARRAIVGFSIGGRYGLLLGTEPRPQLGAVVAFYTRPWPGGVIRRVALAPGDHVDAIGPPVCAIFGDGDDLVPPAMVTAFASELRRRPDHEVHVVAGGHFFANESRRRRYRPDSAEQAWSHALAFLARHLGGGAGSRGAP